MSPNSKLGLQPWLAHVWEMAASPWQPRFWRLVVCLWCAFCLVPITYAQTTTQTEIRVVMDDNYPPFVFRDNDGNLQGILIDQWRLWERQTGIKVQIAAMDWADALRRMRAGEFDVIDTVFKTDERTVYFDFTQSYARLDVPIFFDKEIAGITDLASLQGFAVAAKTGDAAVDSLRRNGVTNLLLFNNYQSIVEAAKDRKINVFVVDSPPALYYLNKLGISTEFRQSAPVNMGEFHRAVKKGNSVLLSTLEQGFAQLSAADLQRIEKKWYGSSLVTDSPYLRYLIYSVAIAVLLIMALVAWNRALSREVNRRTTTLREREARLRAILKAEPESVEVVAPNGRLLEINPAGLAMLEANSLQEAQQQPLIKFVMPAHRSAFLALRDKVLRGDHGRLEYEIQGLRGTRRWLATHAAPLYDDAAQLTTMLSVTHNITERKQAEALTAGQMQVLEMIATSAPLYETLDKLLRVIEAQSPDMLCSILLVDETRTRVWHGAAPSLPETFIQALDGSSIGPQAGSCGTAAFRGEPVFVADIANDPLWADYKDLALSHGLHACWSTPILGAQHEVLGTFAIYYRQPGPAQPAHLKLIEAASHTAAICISRYRTEQALRDSEQRFRQVVENIDEVFWMTDVSKGQMLYISRGYEKIWGRSCASLYQSPRTWLEAIRVEDRERIRDAATSKQASGEYNEEYRIVRPDGSVRWIHDCAFPIRDTDGKVFRIAGVAEDITERRELEEQIRRSQKMEAIGALAGGIAHDFNNILSAINGNAELALQDVGVEHPAFISLKEILKAGGRARNLVQQILTFTTLQQLERQVVALAPIVEETLGFLRVTLPANVELSVDLAAEVPNVMANATQLQQVVLNLCTNAWHALEGRPGRIQVQLSRQQVDAELARTHTDLHVGLYTCLSVQDTGIGMDAVTLQRIFEPFFTTKQEGTGTGLGLSVVQRIMKSNDAAIVVSSELHKGTTFQLYFPAAARPIDAIAPMRDMPLLQGAGQHILYLDDEESIVVLTTRMLERLGYRASGFTDSRQAIAAFRANPQQFDLVVTDYNMLGDTGLDVANKLMSIRPNMPVLLTSGYVTDELKEKAQQAGVRQVIYKPNSVKEFCEAIDAALRECGNA